MTAGEHLIIAPVLIPFLTGALLLLYDDRRRRAKLALSLASALALLVVSFELLARSKGGPLTGDNAISLYLLGNWVVPFGIILVLDRLSAMMLMLTALLAIPALIYSGAGWNRQGQHFQSLFQFLLMGLNGAFLTGDLFNLFVFFEVLLAASYGLLLHGGGVARIRAGLNYIAVNLAASLLFLIGVSLIYGVSGTLSMAQLAQMLPGLAAADRPYVHAGAALMGIAFLIKAGIWPLSFWLPGAYMASSAPVAAMFSVMTKVGIYVIIRLAMLLFGPHAGASAGFGAEVLIGAGMVTIVFGFLGVLASQGLGRVAAHLMLVSSGTALAVLGMVLSGGSAKMLAGALYYVVGSTFATGALFLLIEPMSREDGGIAAMLALTAEAWGFEEEEEDGRPEVGLAIPGTASALGLSFGICVMGLAGLPPLPGFVGKVAILSGMLGAGSLAPGLQWAFLALLLISGLAILVGLLRVGVQTFWASEGFAPRVLALEFAPVLLLVGLLAALSLRADDAMRYMDSTARALEEPRIYAEGVLEARRVTDAGDGGGAAQ